jgi:hypothetical protein
MLFFIGHALMGNRSGLIVKSDLTHADGMPNGVLPST